MTEKHDAHVWTWIYAGASQLADVPNAKRFLTAASKALHREKAAARKAFNASLHDAHCRAPRIRYLFEVETQRQEARLKTLCAAACIWLSPKPWELP